MTERQVTIRVNGRDMTTRSPASIAELLVRLGAPRFVAVELNGDVVPRAQHAETLLRDGDELELVTLVGGG